MTKRLRDKSRLMFKVRKTAMLGAAATMWIAAAPAFSADASTTDLQAAIRDILRTPHHELSRLEKIDSPRLYAVSIGNDDDIIVSADQSALSHVESVEDIDLVNTGDLTGGIGIEVSTGAINMADAIFDESGVSVAPGVYKYIYDDAGNVVSTGTATAEVTRSWRQTTLNRDPLESAIAIDNRGSINFSGREGISASNKAGESITITNSGDIAATQDTQGRAGIYATTETFRYTLIETLTDPGEFTYNADGQLTGVIEPDRWTVDAQLLDMEYDGGTIHIHNTGDIDMGNVGALAAFSEMHSAGIYAKGDGGTTIDNEGDIRVGRGSFGIRAVTNGATSITNSGRIDIGNASAGISVWRSNGNAGDYRLGGDVYVLNTGDILGGIAKDELGPAELPVVAGMHVVALGSNNEYMAGLAHWNLLAAEYNEILGSDDFTIYDVPNLRLYDVTTINRGRIELKDGGHGISVDPLAGFSTAINEGTIIVGDGRPNFAENSAFPSAGVYQRNMDHNGMGLTVSINAQTGIIVTGDDSIGVGNENYAGDSIVINEGSITSGNGVVGSYDSYGETFDRVFQTTGLFSRSFAPFIIGTTSYARNSGSITVGELAIGSSSNGNGDPLLDPTTPTAININEGIIITGDNSAGMAASGMNSTILNTGTITTGSYDISAFQPGKYSGGEFAQLRAGATASAWRFAELINYGSITTGDGKIGAVARSANSGIGYAARVLQSEAGVITTGDHSIGARVHGNLYSLFASAGEISVGDDSIGVEVTSGDVILYAGDMTATSIEGALQVVNAGIIETGDNSVGIRMNGVREDIAWSGQVSLPDPNNPYSYYYVAVSGTTDVTSPSYLQNSGTIRVGANSTAVEITGAAGGSEGLQLFNTGAIEARGGAGTAIRLNADHSIDSVVVNVGTIAGDVTFGAGNDRFTNTLMLDNAGRVTHSGNIIMDGSVIDFGDGDNSFDNDRGTITIAGGDNLITGAHLVMTQATIEARNGAVDSSLTIDGNVSGDFVFGADVDSGGTDRLVIAGDVANGSSMSVVLNATEQLKGDSTFAVITVEGENGGEAAIAGITGSFADSVQGAEVSYSEETGEVTVTARFGMGHMATSVTSATAMAQHWWMQSVGSLDRRDMQQLAGLEDVGLSAWATVFNQEGTVNPTNDLQDVGFDQKLSGMQTGIEWKGDVGTGTFAAGPMFSYGNASANQNANLASAMGDASAYGLNASYRFSSGLYLNASWQQMKMGIDFKTPGTFSNAIGTTDAEGDGFNVDLGYAYKLESGLTLTPQLQYASVMVDLDDFTSSDEVYALSDLGGRHSLLRAGLSVFKTFETTNGSVTPLVEVSYLDAMDGESTLSSNGIAFGSDTSGSGYRAELGIAGRYKAWDITGRLGLSDTTSTASALTSSLTLRYRW